MPRHAFYWLAFLLAPLLVGCDGCRQVATDPEATNPNDVAELETFSTEPAMIYPEDQNADRGAVKPGHWMTAEQPIRSNKADTRGELFNLATVVQKNVNAETVTVDQSNETIRPVVLPKGQMRGFDYRFRCPVPNSVTTRRINVTSRLVPRSGSIVDNMVQSFNVLRGDEYFLVVLTERADQFTRWQVADWVGQIQGGLDSRSQVANYRVVVPDAKGLLSMPETVLDMTSIAVIVWDDISEDALTPLQQKALADWLHFGGRLIVNGPVASESVANTSLSDLLPLLPTSNIELNPAAARELLTANAVSSDRSLDKQVELVTAEISRIAIDGQLDDQSYAVDKTASLVVARPTGRGVIVQPRFDLTDNWITAWDSYDSFINSVVLSRPPREYLQPDDLPVDDDLLFDLQDLRQVFAGTQISSDAAVNTQFRLTARDAFLASSPDGEADKINSRFDPFHRVDAITGVSSWNDRSDAVTLLRETLTAEAGIEIPGSSLVIRSLAIYLVVLVPINFIVFRSINRLEYAWFAVPVIAILGAAWAARQARLDIGFARSNTEMAFLEAHADYPRGHLTRMIGIYNSLSSRYTLQFPTVDGIAAPLENEPDPGTEERAVFRVSYNEGPSLSNFAVPSNRMRYVHAEQIIDLRGSFHYDGDARVTSEAAVDLYDVVVVRKPAEDRFEVALVGSLLPGQSVDLEFRETGLKTFEGLPMQTGDWIRRVAAAKRVPVGSVRMIGRIDRPLPGLQIEPNASQYVGQTIALIHLKHVPPPKPVPDKNLVTDFRRVNRSDATNDSETDQATQDSSQD